MDPTHELGRAFHVVFERSATDVIPEEHRAEAARQWEGAGLSNEEIGDQLVISPETVRTHVRNAMARRGARNRAHLIGLTMRDQVGT